MYTSVLLLVIGLFGFILFEGLSLVLIRYFKPLQILAVLCGWGALSGIVFSVTQKIFPDSVVIALLAAAVGALMVVAMVILVIWGYICGEHYVESRLRK